MYLLMTRWVSRPMAFCLGLVWMAGSAAILHEYTSRNEVDWRGLFAGLPVLMLLGYACLVFALNTTHVRVAPGRIEIRNGPVPMGRRIQIISLEDIAFCFHRLVLVPGRYGTSRMYSAGVQLKNGAWQDIISTFNDAEQAQTAAERIATHVAEGTGRSMTVHSVAGRPPRMDRSGMKQMLTWSAAFVVALLWGVLVDG